MDMRVVKELSFTAVYDVMCWNEKTHKLKKIKNGWNHLYLLKTEEFKWAKKHMQKEI